MGGVPTNHFIVQTVSRSDHNQINRLSSQQSFLTQEEGEREKTRSKVSRTSIADSLFNLSAGESSTGPTAMVFYQPGKTEHNLPRDPFKVFDIP